MKINLSSLRRKANMALFKLKKHSPEIMVIVGCAGTVAGTIMACKETLELEETIDNAKKRIDEVKENYSGDVSEENAKEVDKAYKKELTVAYVKGVGDVVALYAPSVIVSGLSIGMIFGSNNIMRKRNAAVAAAYATVDSMFKSYRQNVIEKYGNDVDVQMRYGLKEETIEEVVTDDKGKSKVVKKKVLTSNIDEKSDYARWFDESCTGWDKDAEYNLMFVKGVEKMCNNKLIADGVLFLNDVYEALGIPRTWAGQNVGWIYDIENPVGDNRVDFRIFDNVERKRAFVNGTEPNILLDFNVDGDIMHDPRLKIYMENI